VKMVSRKWFELVRYVQSTCPKKRPVLQCDEYPFYTSEQGVAWDEFRGEDSPESTKLSMIPASENKAEGDRLGQMFGVCRVPTATYDKPTKTILSNGGAFLTVPLLGDTPKSFYVC